MVSVKLLVFSFEVLIFFTLLPVVRRTHLSRKTPSFKTKNIIKNLLFGRIPTRLFLFNIVSVRKINGFNYPLSHQRRWIQMSFLPSAKNTRKTRRCRRLCLNYYYYYFDSFAILDQNTYKNVHHHKKKLNIGNK